MNSKRTNDSQDVRGDSDEFFSHGRCFPTVREKALKNELSASELQYFRALMLHYRETDNAYIALEALIEMVRREVSPPVWVLESLAEAFSQYPEKPYPKRAKDVKQLNGHSYRRYRQRKIRSFAMIDFVKLVGADFGLSEERAAELVTLKYPIGIEPKSLINRYHDDWADFYESFAVERMDESDRREFVHSFPEVAQGHMQKPPVKT